MNSKSKKSWDPEKSLGHHFTGPEILTTITFNRKYETRGYVLTCKRCGLKFQAKYVLPVETLIAIGVPTCDDFILQQIHES